MNDNSSIQIINSERAVATLLSRFNTPFIMDVIEDNLKMKFRPFNVGPANFATVLDQNFAMTEAQNPSFKDDIEDVRATTHREIIKKICSYYNLTFIGENFEELEVNQLASISNLLYNIFITNFTDNMVWFFGRYILDNKDDIYNSIPNAEEIRKNRETTAYGKRLYTDGKLVVIHAMLNDVLTNIAGHDITFSQLMHYFVDQPTADYLVSIIQDNNDIYKYYYASYINDPVTRPDVFTIIKFQIQNMADKSIDPNQYTTGE